MKMFLFGVGCGTVAGLLLAPQEGRRTRQMLGDRVTRWLQQLQPNESEELDISEEVPDAVAEALNTATKHELRSVRGIGKATADKIVENRPYESEEQVLEEGILPEKTIEKIKEELVEEKKQDVA